MPNTPNEVTLVDHYLEPLPDMPPVQYAIISTHDNGHYRAIGPFDHYADASEYMESNSHRFDYDDYPRIEMMEIP